MDRYTGVIRKSGCEPIAVRKSVRDERHEYAGEAMEKKLQNLFGDATALRCAIEVLPARRRLTGGGFTLIELLAVIVIISILAALSLSGLQTSIASGKISKTRSTIRKLNEALLTYYENYETRRVLVPEESTVSNREQLAELRRIALRRMITLELPERESDITNEIKVQIINNKKVLRPTDGKHFNVTLGNNYENIEWKNWPPVSRRYASILFEERQLLLNDDNPSNDDDLIPSSKLLYMIMNRGPVADPDIISQFRPDEIGDNEFVDGWNNPIRFKRWPVGFKSPYQPIDGALSSRDDRLCEDGHRLVPLIYSAGQDGDFDMNDDFEISSREGYYSPFALSKFEADNSGAEGEVALFQVNWAIETVYEQPTKTYVAARRENGVFNPVAPDGGAFGVPNNPLQTVASEKRKESSGRIRSRDNITNHDLIR